MIKAEASLAPAGHVRLDTYSDMPSEHWHRAVLLNRDEALALSRELVRLSAAKPKTTRRRRNKETNT